MPSKHVLSPAALRKLVHWYQRQQRALPWRKTTDPYRIWVSEILLQQTQVDTVIPYYRRFLRAFPTVRKLAAAPLDAVLKAWEGCGYYARARNLHKAAQIIVESGGRLPRTAQELKTLPGIGDYTAAAIASIAFGEAAAVVDGNVERVLARVLHERSEQKSQRFNVRVRGAADAAMMLAVAQGLAPSDVNQAWMELGATLCRPQDAQCARCPLEKTCRANRVLADVTDLPRRRVRKRVPHYQIGAAIVKKGNKILITQRPQDGMLGGLWEFPGGKQQSGESLEDCVRREIAEELGVEIAVGEKLISVDHGYSHFTITLHCFWCTHRSGRLKKLGVADFRWVTIGELGNFAFPKADRVVLDRLQSEGNRAAKRGK